jgi:phage shock protein PspC (stress-responsive transcriptional regulator)
MSSPVPPPVPLTRAARGRWLGGVCAGIAETRGVPVGGVRGAFVLGALVAGLGVLVYLACWMIIPAEGETAGRSGPRGIASLVLAGAATLGLATLGALGAAATIFGFGWLVALAAALVLVGALASWSRLGPGWALLPVAALVVPSVAMAAGGVRVTAQAGALSYAPANVADLPRAGYESGLGTMVVDLRHTALPASGSFALKIKGGVRRTIVALPHDRCVPVQVRFGVHDFALRAASTVLGRGSTTLAAIQLYRHEQFGGAGALSNLDEPGRGPVLEIDFTSAGGSLLVRDFPDSIDPGTNPGWPGYRTFVDARPDTAGMTRSDARRALRDWRTLHAQAAAANRRVIRNERGPCSAAARKAVAR